MRIMVVKNTVFNLELFTHAEEQEEPKFWYTKNGTRTPSDEKVMCVRVHMLANDHYSDIKIDCTLSQFVEHLMNSQVTQEDEEEDDE